VEALRREGYQGPITFVGDEPPGPVDRPNLSKDYLAGKAPEEWTELRGEDFYSTLDVELVLGDPAERIDPKARTVFLKSGRGLDYGVLLLATGAKPRRLETPGADLSHVHVLRTLADSRAIISALGGKRGVVVIGASFIGLEVAASLRERGLDVDVVAPDAVPLARILGEQIGHFVQKLHEEHGVRFRLGRKPERIETKSVVLDNGDSLPTELVVTGVGVTARTELAKAAGLDADTGIVVDRLFRTSDEHIFAAGDCASYPDPSSGRLIRVEHWVAAQPAGGEPERAVRNQMVPMGRSVPTGTSNLASRRTCAA
jgi:NADPH-dependent 2,4-dienoyl-CoA reductase/sulfur reductase-like enzyme